MPVVSGNPPVPIRAEASQCIKYSPDMPEWREGVTRGEFALWWNDLLAPWMIACQREVEALVSAWPE